MPLIESDSAITRKQRTDKLAASRKVRQRRAYPFIGWDGEGYTAGSRHFYAHFGSSLGDSVTGSSLDYTDCLPLILASPKQAIHVIFAGTYDVTMMFRDTKQRQSVMAGQWTKVGQYSVRFLKGKSLTVKDRETGESRILYDVFSFFGTSFVNACREYLGDSDTLNQIEAMKLQRADFTSMTADVKRYMGQELEYLVLLCEELRKRLALVGIHPTRWHGPGAVASSVLRDVNINQYRRREQPRELVLAAESAYYGGRFEMFQRGTYIGAVYQYDIRSAYPYAMSQLPSLTCEWVHSTHKNIRVNVDYGLYYVRRRHDCNVPHRNSFGMIYFPEWADGWYWGVELPKGIPAIEAWLPDLKQVEFPFSFVSHMYERRAHLKRHHKPEQLALKLALNSLYGKLAQSKGANWNGKQWQKPIYHEPLWSGYITAYTRAMIQRAAELAGPALIAIETDAVFSTEPLDLPLGPGLGQWEQTTYEGIKYVQSGVHMTLSAGEWSYKTRGVTMLRNASDTHIWDDLLAKGSVIIKQVRFGTDYRQPATFGRWYSQKRRLVLDHPDNMEKRISIGKCAQCPPGTSVRWSSKRHVGAPMVDYTSHLHRLIVPPFPMVPSTPYRFIWSEQSKWTDIDDPTLYLEYQPEMIMKGTE